MLSHFSSIGPSDSYMAARQLASARMLALCLNAANAGGLTSISPRVAELRCCTDVHRHQGVPGEAEGSEGFEVRSHAADVWCFARAPHMHCFAHATQAVHRTRSGPSPTLM